MAFKVLTDADFEIEIANSDKPVLVDFWAAWCGPCRKVEPILAEISEEYGDKITIAKLNVDENPSVAQRYQVISIPLLNIYQGGKVVKQIVGAKPKAALLAELAPYL